MHKYFLSALAIVISQAAFANNPLPTTCPSVVAIQAVGLEHFRKDSTEWVGTKNFRKYDTQDTWHFLAILGDAINADNAREKAGKVLAELQLTDGPYHDDALNITVCEYESKYNGKQAWAISPSLNDDRNLMQILRK